MVTLSSHFSHPIFSLHPCRIALPLHCNGLHSCIYIDPQVSHLGQRQLWVHIPFLSRQPEQKSSLNKQKSSINKQKSSLNEQKSSPRRQPEQKIAPGPAVNPNRKPKLIRIALALITPTRGAKAHYSREREKRPSAIEFIAEIAPWLWRYSVLATTFEVLRLLLIDLTPALAKTLLAVNFGERRREGGGGEEEVRRSEAWIVIREFRLLSAVEFHFCGVVLRSFEVLKYCKLWSFRNLWNGRGFACQQTRRISSSSTRMKNLRSSWRYSSEDRRDSGKVWRIRNSNHKEETSGQHRHNVLREQGREDRVTGWGDTGWGGTDRTDYGPSSTAPSYRRVDAKGTETRGDDGWGYTPVENNMSEDLTSAWEALATANLSDWSKPPQIDSVEHWDDTGAKETWDFVKSGRSPVNNPDLYLERNIDWNSRIPIDLLACVDNKNRHRRASPPRSGSPVLLGLETLVDGWENNQSRGKVDVEVPKFIQSRDKLEQGGGSGSWGDANQNGMPGQRRTKQQYRERVSGEKQSNLMRDDYKDRSRKRRGDKDEYHKKPRFRTTHRY